MRKAYLVLSTRRQPPLCAPSDHSSYDEGFSRWLVNASEHACDRGIHHDWSLWLEIRRDGMVGESSILGHLFRYFFLLVPMRSQLLLPTKLMDHGKHPWEESPEADGPPSCL